MDEELIIEVEKKETLRDKVKAKADAFAEKHPKLVGRVKTVGRIGRGVLAAVGAYVIANKAKECMLGERAEAAEISLDGDPENDGEIPLDE